MIPINNETIDYVSWVTQSLQSLVTSGSPAFLNAGTQLLTALAIVMLTVYGLKWAAASVSGHHGHFDFPAAIQFFALFLVAEALIRYYNVALPWTDSSVSSLLPDSATQLAAAIDITALNTLNDRIHTALASMEKPGFDVFMIPVYFGTLGFLTVVQGVMFAVGILGFVAVGIGWLLGPLFIPWLLVPRMSWLFWNWLSFMAQYSFYRIVASALTYIWANVLVKFFDNSLNGDYSLSHFLMLLVPLAMLSIGMLFSVFRIHAFVGDLFRGGATAGSGLATSVAAAIRGSFA